jgi:phosphoglycerate dehydrogenase-like enzyme
VGLGAIGVEIANAASTLGMDVIGYDPLFQRRMLGKYPLMLKRLFL